MKAMQIVWYVLNTLIFLAWVVCVASWIRRGCPVPRWVHVLAGCLLLAGVISLCVLGYSGVFSLRWALLCLLVPPAAAYLGWLWLFGPDEAEDRKGSAEKSDSV